MKRPNGQARSGQVWSGQAMQSDLDPKVHIQHSACYAEATYQLSCQQGHRAQSTQCRYTNRLRAFKHFHYLSAHRNRGVSKSSSAISFGTLHGDALPMIYAKYCLFSRRQKYLKMHLSALTLKGQRSFRGHDTFMP